MTRFRDVTQRALERAGWFPGRSVNDFVANAEVRLSPEFQLFASARAALLEFGGLQLNPVGRGVNVSLARVVLEPTLAWGEEDRFGGYQPILGKRLYPLGEYDNGHFFIAMDEAGAVHLIGVTFVTVAPTMDLALDGFILGDFEGFR
jgi:hypothetical protein